MRINCCCITCVIGETEDEQRPLIQDEKEDDAYKKAPLLTKQPEFSESKDLLEDPSQDAKLHAQARRSSTDNWSRVLGISKKYNVTPTMYDPEDLKKGLLEDVTIKLKINIKMTPVSGVVKIFATKVTNVKTILQGVTSEDEPAIVQIRTKVLPSETRGHTNKLEVVEGITGAMKFRKECLHTIALDEFFSRSIRFRLYRVFKHQRDILLGEYILDISALSLANETGNTNVMMQLHEPNSTCVQPPEAWSTTKPTSGDQENVTSPSLKTFQTTIRRGDTRQSTRKGIPVFGGIDSPKASVSPTPKDELSSESSDTAKEDSESKNIKRRSSSNSPFKRLKTIASERTEKLSEAENATEKMADDASSFKDMSVRLREKYEKKKSKKKHDN